MRKILLSLLIVLLLVGAGLTIANGFGLGNFKIWGVRTIIAENENIDNKNNELSNLVSVTYPQTLADLETKSKTLADTKKDYEEKAVLVSNNRYYMQTEKYEIEFLWTKLGNYAQDNNVQIKIDVVNSTTEGLYDLNFTIAGEYLKVADFMYDLENDSKLGFKVEDFHMSAIEETSSEEKSEEKSEETGEKKIKGVQGRFSCKEISINIEAIEENTTDSSETVEDSAETTDKATTENKVNENTTNTTNTTTNNNVQEQTNTVTE